MSKHLKFTLYLLAYDTYIIKHYTLSIIAKDIKLELIA